MHQFVIMKKYQHHRNDNAQEYHMKITNDEIPVLKR